MPPVIGGLLIQFSRFSGHLFRLMFVTASERACFVKVQQFVVFKEGGSVWGQSGGNKLALKTLRSDRKRYTQQLAF